MMGFIKRQEQRLAVGLLMKRYEKKKMSPPSAGELNAQAARLVDEAHRIARDRGKNVVSIIKDLVQDLKKKDDKSESV